LALWFITLVAPLLMGTFDLKRLWVMENLIFTIK